VPRNRKTIFSETVLCACGCGLPTPLTTYNDVMRSDIKGEPRLCRAGHAARMMPAKSYRKVIGLNGSIALAHRVRAERALGRTLPGTSVVHHADGSIDINAQLVICEDQAYHLLLHLRMRVRAVGGDPNTDKVCQVCRLAKQRVTFPTNRARFDGYSGICRECRVELRCKRQDAKKDGHVV
jgi:hypothetical protein